MNDNQASRRITDLLNELMSVIHDMGAPSHSEALADQLIVRIAAELGVSLRMPPVPPPASVEPYRMRPYDELHPEEQAVVAALGRRDVYEAEYAEWMAEQSQLNLRAEFEAEGRPRWSEADAEGNVTVTWREEPSDE